MKLDCFGDPLPPGALLRLGTIRLRHGVVYSVAFGPKGDFLVSGGSNDSEMRVWETSTGKEIVSFPTHDDPEAWMSNSVFAVAVAPDGDLIAGASGREDCRVYLCSLSRRKKLVELRADGMQGVEHLAFSPDGKLLACSGQVNDTYIWDVARRKVLKELRSGKSQDIAFTPDGGMLVVANQDHEVRIFDVGTGKRRKIIKYERKIESMDVSPDGRLVGCVLQGKDCHSGNVVLTSIPDGKRMRVLPGEYGIRQVRFLPDGKTVAAEGGNFWDCATGQLVRRIEHCGFGKLAFSRDGKLMTFGLELWDLPNGKRMHQFPAHDDDVGAVGFLPDGNLVSIVPTADDYFRLWDGKSGKQVRTNEKEGDPPLMAHSAVSPGSMRFSGAFGTRNVRFFDTATGKETDCFSEEKGKERTVEQMAFSPDGRTLAVATRGDFPRDPKGRIVLVNALTGKKLRDLVGHEASVNSVTFHPSGKRVISGSSDQTVRIWDTETGRELKRLELEGYENRVERVGISPDGKWLASGSVDKTIRLWDVETGKEVHQLKGSNPKCLVFSVDSKFLAWTDSSDDPTIHFFDIAKRKEVHRLKGHRAIVTCLAFSADGKRLASGSEDTTVLVWDMSGVK